VALFLITKTHAAKQYGSDQDKTNLTQKPIKKITVIIRITVSSTEPFVLCFSHQR